MLIVVIIKLEKGNLEKNDSEVINENDSKHSDNHNNWNNDNNASNTNAATKL